MTERWLPLVDEPNYEVSSEGRIRNARRGNILKPSVGSKRTGHLKITLRGKSVWVHILVCAAFHGERPTPQHEVRHKNGVASDNRSENLEWGTRRDQRLDDVRNGVHYWAKRDRCSRGHEYTPENTRIESWGARRCLTCKRAEGRDYMRRKRAALNQEDS